MGNLGWHAGIMQEGSQTRAGGGGRVAKPSFGVQNNMLMFCELGS